MRGLRRCLAVLAAAGLVAGQVGAAVVIEMRDGAGTVQQVTIDGTRARFQAGDAAQYALLDLARQELYLVQVPERRVLDMSKALREPFDRSTAEPHIELLHLGSGPSIASYATERYRLSAGSLHCHDAYLSKALLEEPELEAFFAIFHRLARGFVRAMSGATGPPPDPCERGEAVLAVLEHGVPMRMVGPRGELEEEIISVRRDVVLPARVFALPPGYCLLGGNRVDRVQNDEPNCR